MKRLLSINTLRRLAGPRSFSRGEDYFNRGLVRSLSERDGMVTAKVKGTHTYTVNLREDDGELDYSCTCPMGDDGNFCKHCVATGLSWLERKADGKKGKNGRKDRVEVTMKDVKAYLVSLDKKALIEMVLEQTGESDALCEKLMMRAARNIAGRSRPAALKKIIREAISPGDFIGYYEMRAYASRIDNVIEHLERLSKENPAEAIDLLEYAIEEMESALHSVDDSNGEMGGILEHLQVLHLAACRKAKPDPEELAARLFNKELNGEWDVFRGAAVTYAPILGETGLARYRRLAEEEWKKIEPLGPNREERVERSHHRFNITFIMESLAKVSGDLEAMVDVKKKDLSCAYRYLQIAELYKKSGDRDRALQWAEAGIKAFPARTDSRLRDFLAAEYHRRRRHDDAMKLIWAEFSDHPCLANYQKLKAHAERIGQWPFWREKALDSIRKNLSKTKRTEKTHLSWRWGEPWGGSSMLVEIFLWEKNPDAAWQEALEGGCSEHLWMKLAAEREKEHPEDAIQVYQRWLDPIVDRKNNLSYEEAAKLIEKIRLLMNRLDQDAAFADYLQTVRAAHKPKRNFMKLLDRIG